MKEVMGTSDLKMISQKESQVTSWICHWHMTCRGGICVTEPSPLGSDAISKWIGSELSYIVAHPVVVSVNCLVEENSHIAGIRTVVNTVEV